ncbi:MAG TPA: 4Fe-4S binding protein [Polyangia bacterium]|jgi:polyferredoxin
MGIDRLRRITQGLGALLGHGYLMVVATRAIYQGPLKGVCLPMMSCTACPAAIVSCPIGALQHFMTLREVPWLLLGGLVLWGAIFGRMGCGWLCPFGLVQDLLYKLPSPKISLPGEVRYLKYATLVVLVIALPLLTQVPWFSQLCPVGTLTAGIPWVAWDPVDAAGRPALASPTGMLFAVKVGILVALLVLIVASKRPFCRALCPLGAIFSLFARVSLVRLRVAPACRGCGRCQSVCPVDHAVAADPGSGECVRCLACTSCRHVEVGLAADLAPAPPDNHEARRGSPLGVENGVGR